uniref:Glucose-methanol-choline oxidoreductase N-terminal domain-containing protein n=1 Tax=Phlebotomus papatasi TaxID=29031 RepID=A0A1B0DFC6_PHLPP
MSGQSPEGSAYLVLTKATASTPGNDIGPRSLRMYSSVCVRYLIEAGGDENEVTDTPAMAGYLQLTEFDWQYQTQPPPDGAYCQAMIGHRCNWPRGKVMGGSSVLNAMVYVRGNRRDYDYWQAQGNPGWSFDDVLPYFTKSEDNRNPSTVQLAISESRDATTAPAEPPPTTMKS